MVVSVTFDGDSLSGFGVGAFVDPSEGALTEEIGVVVDVAVDVVL